MRLYHCFLFTVLFCKCFGSQLQCTVSAESAILINAETGAILFEKNATKSSIPASITKVATVLLVLKEKGDDLDQLIAADQEAIGSITPSAKKRSNYKKPAYWIETGSSHIGIKRGEEMRLKDLLHAILLASANDASNVVAQHVGEGSIPKFMDKLNAYLQELGCKETQFLNPHGLHHPDHKTTAYDMAMIAKEAMKNAFFRETVMKRNYICEETNKQPVRALAQTNLLLKKGPYYYEKAIGVKTGYTSDAGATLVAAAKDENRTLIAVVLGCKDRKETCQDVITLFDAAFEEKKITKRILVKGVQNNLLEVPGGSKSLQTYLVNDVEFSFYPSEEVEIQPIVEWKKLSLPIEKDAEVGQVVLSSSCGLIERVPLFAASSVKPTLWFSLKEKWGSSSSTVSRGTFFAGMSFLSFGMLWWLFKKRKKR